jgi:hypothetical protein
MNVVPLESVEKNDRCPFHQTAGRFITLFEDLDPLSQARCCDERLAFSGTVLALISKSRRSNHPKILENLKLSFFIKKFLKAP